MNSLDGAFCKKCGATLPEEEVAAGLLKLEELSKEGFHLFNEGRTEEARMVAEAALLTHPSFAAALSLKGMCHEREGHVAEALECFERVVEQNPDSTLDKIKVAQLRNKLAAPIPEPAPNKTLAIAGAAATVALVIALGALFGSINVNAKDKTAMNKPAIDAGVGRPMPPAQEPAEKKVDPNQTVGEAPPVVNPGSGTGIPPVSPNGSGITIPPYEGPKLPDPNDQGNKPITLDVRGLNNDNSTANKTEVAPKPGTDPPPVEVEQKQVTRPVMEMTIISGGGTRKLGGGSEPVNSGLSAKALLEAANAKFMLGRYGEAAQAYQSALNAGAKAGSTNQRLADSYKHLGQKDAAIAAYSRAAKAYEESGNARAADVCRQAIKDLGG
ncbi:MAG: tetratricopeptide repeat protein [Fimbriimonadaceae bacterium]